MNAHATTAPVRALHEAPLDELVAAIERRVNRYVEPRRTLIAQLVLSDLHARIGAGNLSLAALRAIRLGRRL